MSKLRLVKIYIWLLKRNNMTLVPLSLRPLDPDHISQLYERVETNEPTFRNILVDLSDDDNEADFFRTASLDSIFEKYIRVSGYSKRVSDFRVGQFVSDDIPGYRFQKFDPSKLREDEALVLIEKSNDSWLKLYHVLGDSSVRAGDSLHYHQF